MGLFPAAGEFQLDFIKSFMDKCDFYVHFLAGRHGTPTADSKSYLEKNITMQCQKACRSCICCTKILKVIHKTSLKKTDEGNKRLADFISLFGGLRLRKIGQLRRP